MITEVSPTFFAIRINGKVTMSNIPSRQLAESMVFNLPNEQRVLAEIVPVTSEGKTVLFG